MMIHIMSDKSLSDLTGVQEGDTQPNAVDLRVDKIFRIHSDLFLLNNESKTHRGSTPIEPDEYGYWTLEPGSYEIVMENLVNVGEDEAGWVITRSTLNRNGVFITSGLYDSGYHGVMAGAMHVTSGVFKLQKGTRVGQFLLFKSESLSKYDGDYGLNKSHDKKYT